VLGTSHSVRQPWVALALALAAAATPLGAWAADGGSDGVRAVADASADGGTAGPDARAGSDDGVPGLQDDASAGPTDTEQQVLSVIAGVKDLTELSLEQLLGIELTTSTKSKPMSLRDSPNVMTLVTREEIQRSGARELADVLRLVPGIAMHGDLYSSVYAGFRGIWGSEGKLLLLFEGHEMFDLLYYGTELGNRIPVDQIDRIEIIRGPGSVVYGDSAELLVINVITRSVQDLEGAEVSAVYGQMFDGALHHDQSLAGSYGHRTVSALVGRTFGGPDGLALKAGIYVGQGNRSDQPYTDIAGVTYNMAGNAHSDPLLLHLSAEYRGLKLGYLFEDYRTTMRDGNGETLADTLPVDYLTSSLNLTYAWKLASNLTLSPRIHWLWQKPWQTDSATARDRYPDYYWHPTAQRILGGLALTWDVLPSLNLLLGGDAYLDSATNDVEPFVDPNDPTRDTTHVSYGSLAGYGQALLDTAWVNLVAGARYDYRQHVGGSFVPRAAATKTFGPFHFKLLYSRAFRTPAMSNLVQNVGVKPETTTVAELELGYRIAPSLFVVANGFDITIDKPFVYFFDAATVTNGYRNFDRVGTRGAELELRFSANRNFANLSYSFYTATGKDRIAPLAVPGRSDVLLGFAPHKLALLAGAGLTSRLEASVSALLLAGPRFGYYAKQGDTSIARNYGSELQLNAFVSYRDLLAPGSFVGLGLYNLANAATVLIQPYDNGHPPLPGPSRELFLRVGYDATRKGQARGEPPASY
jgi:outer membrane receptor protein involved in Fe transport